MYNIIIFIFSLIYIFYILIYNVLTMQLFDLNYTDDLL